MADELNTFGPETTDKLLELVGAQAKRPGSRVKRKKDFRDPQPPTVRYVQCPSGGLPAMSGVAPEETDNCELLEVAKEAGTGYSIGDFIRTETTLTVRNYTEDIHGDSGMRIVQIFYDGNPSNVQNITGHSCTNTGTDTDIKDK